MVRICADIQGRKYWLKVLNWDETDYDAEWTGLRDNGTPMSEDKAKELISSSESDWIIEIEPVEK